MTATLRAITPTPRWRCVLTTRTVSALAPVQVALGGTMPNSALPR